MHDLSTAEKVDEDTLSRFRNNEIGGVGYARVASDMMDARLAELARNSLPDNVAFVALGGYGRRRLCPHSDVDVMFLVPDEKDAARDRGIENFLYTLWDSGIKVGHSTRTLKDCARVAREDLSALTSMLDSRLVCGPEPLFSEMQNAIRSECDKQRNNLLVSRIMQERDGRHKRLGDSRYVLEPNIKEGKGGLRDYQTLFWMTNILYGARTPEELAELSILSRQEARHLGKALEYLLTVRCHLHDIAGRPEERLHFDIQPELAARFGYSDRNDTKAVERFMKHYFLLTRDVGNLSRIICAVIEAKESEQKTKPREHDGFLILNERLDFRPESSLLDNPVEMIRIFRVAQEAGIDIHPFAFRNISKHLKLLENGLRFDQKANELFLEILTSDKGAAHTLRKMNEAGVLGKFIPAFGKIIALMQFDRYHIFTVDEHTIRAVDILHKIENRELAKEAPAATRLFPKIENRRALYVAMLLHDICKGRRGKHSLLGAELALSLCPRLGLDDNETRLVSWIVFDHLTMSDIAFRRDLEDPKTIEDFAFRVYDPERLRLLLVLTTADIIAVGPDRWTSWKAKLLEDLYLKTENALKGAGPGTGEKIVLPGDYKPGDIRVHIEPARKIEATSLTVYSPDKPGLFADIAGGLSAAGANIIEARIETLEDGTAVDTFTIQNLSGKPLDKPWRQEQLKSSVINSLKGELDIRKNMTGQKSHQPRKDMVFDIPVKVEFDDRASRTDTVIEISACDRPGLLYDLTCIIRDHGLVIGSAKITTHGLRAVDVFYVRNRDGGKVTDDKLREELRNELRESAGLREPAA